VVVPQALPGGEGKGGSGRQDGGEAMRDIDMEVKLNVHPIMVKHGQDFGEVVGWTVTPDGTAEYALVVFLGEDDAVEIPVGELTPCHLERSP
jgi:hypothetical protein